MNRPRRHQGQRAVHQPLVALMPALRLVLVLCCMLLLGASPSLAATEEAVLAGGCFWCLEHDLERLPGVIDVESGYSGGTVARPTYEQVSRGTTGHQESVRVRFDNSRISYATLLRAFWRHVDPLDGSGQFCDRGDSYRPVIFSDGPAQRRAAEASLDSAARELTQPSTAIKVAIRPFSSFWPAEAYHQNYATRNRARYRFYRWSCGRDRRLDEVWESRARRSDAWQLN